MNQDKLLLIHLIFVLPFPFRKHQDLSFFALDFIGYLAVLLLAAFSTAKEELEPLL
jgi:hypothetical protein